MTTRTLSTIALSVLVISIAGSLTVGCGAQQEAPQASSTDPYVVALQVSAPSALPKCTSSLAGTTAYVASPAGLWSCSGTAWNPIPCTNAVAGAVAYASATKTLWSCVSGLWTQVALGVPGPPGKDGNAGASSLIAQFAEPAGPNCANGGTRVAAGADINADGVLQTSETSSTSYVCNATSITTTPCNSATLAYLTPKLAGCILVEADLSGRNLSGVDLENANLTRANLSGASLAGANLTGAIVTGANLTGTDLTGVRLTGIDLTNTDLRGAILTGAILTGAKLAGANVGDMDLRGLDLTGADLTGANLGGAWMHALTGSCPARLPDAAWRCVAENPTGLAILGPGVNISNADLAGRDLTRANLSGAILGGATLAGADLTGANLDGARLGSANLTGANLTGASLGGADLEGARLGNLVGACPASPGPAFCLQSVSGKLALFGNGVDLSNADISGVELPAGVFTLNLSGANLRRARLPAAGTLYWAGPQLAGADFTGADMHGVTFGYNTGADGANFSGANLSAAYFFVTAAPNANFTGANLRNLQVYQSSLSGSNFTGADLTGAGDWTRDAYGHASQPWHLLTFFFPATFSNTICPNGTNSDAGSGRC
jgi:uncharacterized protein YjbI with pentapeptide repeats